MRAFRIRRPAAYDIGMVVAVFSLPCCLVATGLGTLFRATPGFLRNSPYDLRVAPWELWALDALPIVAVVTSIAGFLTLFLAAFGYDIERRAADRNGEAAPSEE